jgi:muconolactone delta-isomerase
MPVSESAWKRLNDAQERLQEEEEQAMAKILRLRKQQKLLKKRAGEFLQKDIKDISELEKLEE